MTLIASRTDAAPVRLLYTSLRLTSPPPSNVPRHWKIVLSALLSSSYVLQKLQQDHFRANKEEHVTEAERLQLSFLTNLIRLISLCKFKDIIKVFKCFPANSQNPKKICKSSHLRGCKLTLFCHFCVTGTAVMIT